MRRIAFALAACLVSCNAAPAAPATTIPTEFVIPTRSPAPTGTPFTGHYGFLVATASGYVVRREDSAATLATIDLENVAVSPDGRLVAGFTHGGGELRVADVAAPTSFRSLAMPAGERGLYVVWSVDQSGVLYSVAGTGWTALRTFTFAASPPAELARFADVTLRPALWDPIGGELAAAFVVSGRFASEYVVIRGSEAAERRALPDKGWQDPPATSGDGRWVMLASTLEPTLRVFQSDIPNVVLESHGTSADASTSAVGRPRSSALAVVFDRELLMWDPSTNVRARVPTTAEIIGVVCFRFDGSAIVVRTADGIALAALDGTLTPVSGDVRFGVALP